MNQPTIKLHSVLLDLNNSIRYYFQFEGNEHDTFCIDVHMENTYFQCTMGERKLKTIHGERCLVIEPTGQSNERCMMYLKELHEQAQNSNQIFDWNDIRRDITTLNKIYNHLIQFAE